MLCQELSGGCMDKGEQGAGRGCLLPTKLRMREWALSNQAR